MFTTTTAIVGASVLASIGSELAGYGTFIGGIVAAAVFAVTTVRTRHKATINKDEIVAKATIDKEELKQALIAHSKEMKDHVTASRVQTLRYVDRKLDTLHEGQETLFDMVLGLEAVVTKPANTSRKPHNVGVSAETKRKV